MADATRMVDALVRARGPATGRTVAGVALGGLALVAGLAFRALRGDAGEPRSEQGTPPNGAKPDAGPFAGVDEDEARLMLRAMVAATVADGMVDAEERRRLEQAVTEAGIDADGRAWLERELSDPADVDEIADRVNDPDAAARIYAAARLAIDTDTMQERQFLSMLATALDVPEEATAHLDRALAG